MKTCKICEETKELSQFYVSKRHTDGYFHHCKSCHKEKTKNWPSQSPQASAKRSRKWRKDNSDYLREHKKRHYEENKSDILARQEEYSKQYYREHREWYLEYGKDWKRRNRERIRTNQRRRYANNKARYIAKTQRYRARRAGATGEYSEDEWSAVVERYGNRCLRCGIHETFRKLTVDHILPLSMGGTNWIWNIQPLCGPCNSSKGDRYYDYRANKIS